MWIVRYAIAHRHTVGVMAILLFLFGGLSMRGMSTDILPPVNIPAINLIWTYQGLNAPEMASKVTSFSELAIMNNVDNIRELRSETLNGVAIVRVAFQPGTNVTNAFAQVTSVSQTILRRMPPGTMPPLIIPYVPSSVPVLQLVLASDTLNDGALFDYARLQLRAQIQSIRGLRLSLPYGGAPRQVMIDLDPDKLQAYGLSASDVAAAVASQNLTLPSGALRTGAREILITTNASPETIETFADLPLRSVEGRSIKISDVASVRDGQAVQTNIARLDGQNAVLVSILKLGDASTVEIIREIHRRMPELRAAAPEGVTIAPIFDQSVFVENALNSVIGKAVIVALLVAFVVLVFVGSWRSSFIVLTSIPLALLASVTGLAFAGETFNIMTLSGLMLAIGILVDNALVEIENINRNLESGVPLREAVLKSASEVAFPEFVSTTAICIVFSPLFLLTGTAAFVFKPLALSVIFALIASYLLSRTLVPSLAMMLLKPHAGAPGEHTGPRWHAALERTITRLSEAVGAFVHTLTRRKALPFIALAVVVAIGGWTATRLGSEFFPETDAGMIRLYVRADSGLRVEETARKFADVQRAIRDVVPAHEIGFIAENIGPPEPINLGWIESGVIGSFDGEILIQLGQERTSTATHASAIRAMLRERFPNLTVYFRPADATAQTLAGSAQTAIEVRLIGRDRIGNAEAARELQERIRSIPGAVDVALRQVSNLPSYYIEIDRVRALQIGITPQDASTAILSTLGTAGTVTPSFWSDPVQGAAYTVQIVAPPSHLVDIEQLMNTPVRSAASGRTVPLRTVASLQVRHVPANIDRTTLMPTLTVLANVEGRDLGGVYGDVAAVIADIQPRLKPGNRIEVAGQARSMTQAYAEMAGGLVLAAVLVYLVMVVNFQSWLLPFIAMSGLPVAITGALIALDVTGTPLSVPALTGLIMVIGVSTANSVLVTSFARDNLANGMTPLASAIDATKTRLRPVMMTAIAMIAGVLPMALGAGEGGEQNAPLGRAVIGGLMLGTGATLSFVPFLFALLARARPKRDVDDIETASPKRRGHDLATSG
ncbi:efflux RND transporter permease subunit [Hyphomicrobium sp.]|uniref:efflux RND transporter permease subunit n=1 Tax=Hyphomicrobium sp. TaxID=82 RepID=UPI002C6849DE|nr:efflux RND transporter permease subunit [Hyphomicrobium sp.]HRN88546.1 efflux RND transporter permease subunit [Hyphomicrobium sp.]HRQ26733.1 efflux RND transporter permease subunit [Hyphomicrobium sp.]